MNYVILALVVRLWHRKMDQRVKGAHLLLISPSSNQWACPRPAPLSLGRRRRRMVQTHGPEPLWAYVQSLPCRDALGLPFQQHPSPDVGKNLLISLTSGFRSMPHKLCFGLLSTASLFENRYCLCPAHQWLDTDEFVCEILQKGLGRGRERSQGDRVPWASGSTCPKGCFRSRAGPRVDFHPLQLGWMAVPWVPPYRPGTAAARTKEAQEPTENLGAAQV